MCKHSSTLTLPYFNPHFHMRATPNLLQLKFEKRSTFAGVLQKYGRTLNKEKTENCITKSQHICWCMFKHWTKTVIITIFIIIMRTVFQ